MSIKGFTSSNNDVALGVARVQVTVRRLAEGIKGKNRELDIRERFPSRGELCQWFAEYQKGGSITAGRPW